MSEMKTTPSGWNYWVELATGALIAVAGGGGVGTPMLILRPPKDSEETAAPDIKIPLEPVAGPDQDDEDVLRQIQAQVPDTAETQTIFDDARVDALELQTQSQQTYPEP